MSFFDRFRPAATISVRDIDPDALSVLRRLTSQKYTAYLVGGGVRDLLLGRVPKDFDVATDARPNQIRRLFRNAFVIGRRFKLVLICFGQKQIETATFRRDPEPNDEEPSRSGNSDSLYQDKDNTYGSPEEDAYRRDFTVNALFWDPQTEKIVDYTGGLHDLRKKVLRCIGDPAVRFQEDPVRMLRAVRLSSRLGFSIHPDSVRAIERHGAHIADASRPRVFDEILRLFTFSKSREALGRLWETGLMSHVLPAVCDYVERSGGRKSPLWAYLEALDEAAETFDTEHRESPRYVQENAIRLATLLTPLFREALRAADNRTSPLEMARGLVEEIIITPFRTPGWRVPRALCYDLADILASLAQYASRSDARRKRALSLPWFNTARSLWHIAAKAENDREARDVLLQWDRLFEEYVAQPHPDRKGTYIPVNPDKASRGGFPGDVPEDRDALVPARRPRPAAGDADAADESGAPRRRRRRGHRGGRGRRKDPAATAPADIAAGGDAPGPAAGADAPQTSPQPQELPQWFPASAHETPAEWAPGSAASYSFTSPTKQA